MSRCYGCCQENCGYTNCGCSCHASGLGDPNGAAIKRSPYYSTPTSTVDRVVSTEAVQHPAHYGGKDDPYEAIKVIEAWKLGFNLGNCAKYISRAGKKDPTKTIEDLEKALFYLKREIDNLKK